MSINSSSPKRHYETPSWWCWPECRRFSRDVLQHLWSQRCLQCYHNWWVKLKFWILHLDRAKAHSYLSCRQNFKSLAFWSPEFNFNIWIRLYIRSAIFPFVSICAAAPLSWAVGINWTTQHREREWYDNLHKKRAPWAWATQCVLQLEHQGWIFVQTVSDENRTSSVLSCRAGNARDPWNNRSQGGARGYRASDLQVILERENSHIRGRIYTNRPTEAGRNQGNRCHRVPANSIRPQRVSWILNREYSQSPWDRVWS